MGLGTFARVNTTATGLSINSCILSLTTKKILMMADDSKIRQYLGPLVLLTSSRCLGLRNVISPSFITSSNISCTDSFENEYSCYYFSYKVRHLSFSFLLWSHLVRALGCDWCCILDVPGLDWLSLLTSLSSVWKQCLWSQWRLLLHSRFSSLLANLLCLFGWISISWAFVQRSLLPSKVWVMRAIDRPWWKLLSTRVWVPIVLWTNKYENSPPFDEVYNVLYLFLFCFN